MLVKKYLFSLSFLILLHGVASAGALIVAGWNFNAQDLTRTEGSQGDLSVYTDWLTHESWGTGTEVGALPEVPAGSALDLFTLVDVFGSGGLLMENLDFTGLSDIQLNFAIRSEALFVWNERMNIQYRLGEGAWNQLSLPESIPSEWTEAHFAIPVAGLTDVSLRIHVHSWVETIGVLEFDNVVISAVPEPRLYALLAGILGLATVITARRRG